MWEMFIDFDWDEFRSIKFDSPEDAYYVMRSMITRMMGPCSIHYEEFRTMVEDYCEEYYLGDTPEGIKRFLDFLDLYVAEPDFPGDLNRFYFKTFEDENILIALTENPKTLNLMLQSSEVAGKVPGMMLPLEVAQDPQETTLFIISNNIGTGTSQNKQAAISLNHPDKKNLG